jgi:hypothetical protein
MVQFCVVLLRSFSCIETHLFCFLQYSLTSWGLTLTKYRGLLRDEFSEICFRRVDFPVPDLGKKCAN